MTARRARPVIPAPPLSARPSTFRVNRVFRYFLAALATMVGVALLCVALFGEPDLLMHRIRTLLPVPAQTGANAAAVGNDQIEKRLDRLEARLEATEQVLLSMLPPSGQPLSGLPPSGQPPAGQSSSGQSLSGQTPSDQPPGSAPLGQPQPWQSQSGQFQSGQSPLEPQSGPTQSGQPQPGPAVTQMGQSPPAPPPAGQSPPAPPQPAQPASGQPQPRPGATSDTRTAHDAGRQGTARGDSPRSETPQQRADAVQAALGRLRRPSSATDDAYVPAPRQNAPGEVARTESLPPSTPLATGPRSDASRPEPQRPQPRNWDGRPEEPAGAGGRGPDRVAADQAMRNGLVQARDALNAGRVQEAQRLLQVVQLQLVFRPSGQADRGQGAGEVGRTLAALAAGDTGQARRYLDQAIGVPEQSAHN
jgi:hypothetical protein